MMGISKKAESRKQKAEIRSQESEARSQKTKAVEPLNSQLCGLNRGYTSKDSLQFGFEEFAG